MKKRILSMIIVVVLCMNLLVATVFADEVENNSVYELWVGSVQVTDENANDVLGDGTVSYDADTNTLTLNNANITSETEYKEGRMAGIYSKEELSILLKGEENVVTALGTTKYSRGIYVDGSLYISGSGTLKVNAGAVTSEQNDADSVGIFTTGQLSISEVYVLANGGRAIATDEYAAYSNGVYTDGGIDISFGGGLIATGNEAYGLYAYSTGIDAYGNEENYINISVYDGYLEAVGGQVKGVTKAGSNGVFMEDGGLYVYDKSAMVVLKSSLAEVTSTVETDNPFAFSNGIYVYAGDVSIDAGNATFSSGDYKGIAGESHTICVESRKDLDENGEIIGSSGGWVNINCDDVTVSKHSPALVGTSVNIISGNGYAIYADMGIEISKKLQITTPSGGKIEGIGGVSEPQNYVEPEYWTVVDNEGNIAKSISIKPLSYKVSINGLVYNLAANVPAGKSLNDTYCEMFEIEDFSEVIEREREGYTLDGWYTDENCTDGNEYDFNSLVTADITIYAKWVANVVEEPQYVPVVEKTEGGEATVSVESAKAGTTVVIAIKPNDGMEVDIISVSDKNGVLVPTIKNSDGTYSFVQPEGDVNIKVTYKTKTESITPETGDNNNMVFWLILLCISGSLLFFRTDYNSKKND